ncbi:MAG: radical SAM protein, partial [Christensenellales bacterium]
MDLERLKRLYYSVSKPSRYTGGEFNLPDMEKPAKIRACMCFPDVYEIAMSNLGIRILYHMLNDRADTVCERCFCPWVDLMDKLKEENLPLCSIETGKPLKSFDFVGFSVQYEMAYTNVLKMFELSDIPFYAADRGEEYPIIVAGGPCMANPEPFADFFDLLMIGEGEEMLSKFADLMVESKALGRTKAEILSLASKIEGCVVPSCDRPLYGDGRIVGFTRKVTKAVVRDFENSYFPTKMLLPNTEAIHDRAVLELYRGCTNGCRFCQAGFYYRPVRKRSAETLERQAKELIDYTGFNDLSFSSLSTGDYPQLKELIERL